MPNYSGETLRPSGAVLRASDTTSRPTGAGPNYSGETLRPTEKEFKNSLGIIKKPAGGGRVLGVKYKLANI